MQNCQREVKISTHKMLLVTVTPYRNHVYSIFPAEIGVACWTTEIRAALGFDTELAILRTSVDLDTAGSVEFENSVACGSVAVADMFVLSTFRADLLIAVWAENDVPINCLDKYIVA
jgi:hypothetical protein